MQGLSLSSSKFRRVVHRDIDVPAIQVAVGTFWKQEVCILEGQHGTPPLRLLKNFLGYVNRISAKPISGGNLD